MNPLFQKFIEITHQKQVVDDQHLELLRQLDKTRTDSVIRNVLATFAKIPCQTHVTPLHNPYIHSVDSGGTAHARRPKPPTIGLGFYIADHQHHHYATLDVINLINELSDGKFVLFNEEHYSIGCYIGLVVPRDAKELNRAFKTLKEYAPNLQPLEIDFQTKHTIPIGD
jgi:hypothetical protein